MRSHPARRFAFAGVGLVVMALGIAVMTLAGLGTSPISAPVWVATLAGGLTFGGWTLVLNALMFVAQLLILRRRFPATGWLQLPAALVFSSAIDLWMWVFGWIQPGHYALQALQVLVGAGLLGLGVAIQVAPDALYLPGEGLIATIAKVTRSPFARLKVVFDVTLVAAAVLMSFLFFGELRGLREGTVVAAFLVGTVVGVTMPAVRRTLAAVLGDGR
ncbi:YczE/YyaS/YitT family protein [Tessaracoccus oleiagri]|uniref:Uncharacterized membrane protein YczE n=1 Tax=Tessaracoccus oleiagri TaxID=686624 RepID=A0A1G9I4A9_9ACTN|nr:DUF6198 family protein [Tessaracoccus oleiagri]SDL19885.1 Uncharacterized membrane protein YczE [Tessaracoccus oleiagri]